MRIGSFRGRTLLAVLGVAAVSLAVFAVLLLGELRATLLDAIQRPLIGQTRLAAALLLQGGAQDSLDQEADRLGAMTGVRVTLIAPDGRVVGDSMEPAEALPVIENHGTRPEVLEARRSGMGIAERHSATVGVDLLYTAVPIDHPDVAIVRLAAPLTDVDRQVAAVGQGLVVALSVALVCALALGWISANLLSRRVNAIARTAQRYAEGDFSNTLDDHGSDELGTVARVLDQTALELGRRMTALAEDRARMEAILSGMLEGVVVVNREGRVVLINDAAGRLLRVEGVAPGQDFLDVWRHPEAGAMLAEALDGRAPEPTEFSPPREPGRTIVARAAPVAAGDGRGAVFVLHDISDLRHADRMRRDFVANVSHELRTPLTAIQGYVEALLDEDPDDEEQRLHFLEIIARHAERMERLVRDLLRLAGLEAGQEVVDLAPTNIESVFTGIVSELSQSIDAKRQTVNLAIDPAARLTLTDPAKLHDAVRNLVENAVAYAPAETTIELAALRDGDRLVITVSDEGPGIPQKDLARIFERFYRIDRARSRESGGTGLGLSIVKHIVALMGGEVKAANRKTGGAVLEIRLPWREPSATPTPPTLPPHAG
ncbi:MAG: ATP-binding protein [Acidobacteriota bacterium]